MKPSKSPYFLEVFLQTGLERAPQIEQDLAADDSGSSPRAFFESFEAVMMGSRIKGLKAPSVEDQQQSPPALAGCGDGSHRGLAVVRRGDPTNCRTVGVT